VEGVAGRDCERAIEGEGGRGKRGAVWGIKREGVRREILWEREGGLEREEGR
jgi:hypothetical protein